MSTRPSGSWRQLRRSRLWRIVTAGLTVAIVWYCWPTTLGGSMTVVAVSGHSMEPTYHSNDMLLLRRSNSYGPGDVAVYTIPQGQPGAGHRVVHRITSITSEGRYMFKGDNKPTFDDWTVHKGDIQGKVIFLIPQGARWLALLLSPLMLGMAGATVVMWLLWPTSDDDTPAGDDDPSSEQPVTTAALNAVDSVGLRS